MVVLVSAGFGLTALAKRNPAYAGIAEQFEHKPWEWIAFWDLIQPAFMFMRVIRMLGCGHVGGTTSLRALETIAIRQHPLRLISTSQ